VIELASRPQMEHAALKHLSFAISRDCDRTVACVPAAAVSASQLANCFAWRRQGHEVDGSGSADVSKCDAVEQFVYEFEENR
jgi:hypothetical protein